MERGERKIKSGAAYDHLFPKPDQGDKTVKNNADVEDTIALIKRTVPETLWHTEKIAKKLKGSTLEETCSNIWHFVYDHIQYKRDKDGVEQVRSPRRTWWERETGVDCDCYTEFICSILLNLNIPHTYRITKYPKRLPEVPRWQHIYPIVPKSGRLIGGHLNRDDYIVIDCVKDEFDDEQPFLESKDYDMRLDYLDGLEDEVKDQADAGSTGAGLFTTYENVDASDIASIDDEELGKFGDKLKKAVKKVGNATGQGLRFLNRYTNPGTILLRNGLLLAMKINLLNVAGRIRWGYLTDEQAKAMNMNLDALSKVRHIKDRAETLYYQAGGKKKNLKKAILKGKGNHNKKVPLNGLDGIDDEYADIDEYNIIHDQYNAFEGLGDPVDGSALAAATSVMTALGLALKQVKGLFNKGSAEEKSFQSETDNAGDRATAPPLTKEDDDELEDSSEASQASTMLPAARTATSDAQTPASTLVNNITSTASRLLPATSSSGGRATADVETTTQTATDVQPVENSGVAQKTTAWIKDNPGKSLAIAGALLAGGFLLARSITGKKNNTSHEVSGLPSTSTKKKRRKKYKPKKSKSYTSKNKIEFKNLL